MGFWSFVRRFFSTTTAQPAPTTPQPVVEAGVYERPFGPYAPWNIPVWGLPEHEQSALYVERLWSGAKGNFNISTESYTYPVYVATVNTPFHKVESRNPGWGNLHGKLIPFDPKWLPASGSDAQIIVLDPIAGAEYDLLQVKFENGVVKISNGSRVPGNYMTYEGGNPPSRGCGIQYLAMLVRPQEVRQGVIKHALSMPIPNPDGSIFVPPATKLERKTSIQGVPQGMRFRLKVSEEAINAWSAALPLSETGKASARVIARALRDYGWFITDTSGGAHLQLESVLTADWASLGLGRTVSGGKEYPRDLLDGLLQKDRIVAVVDASRY